MRTTITHRHTKTLSTSENDVGTPLSRRSQNRQTQQIGCNRNKNFFFLCRFNQRRIIYNLSVGIWVLNDDSKGIFIHCEVFPLGYFQFYTQRIGPCNQHIQRLWPYFFVYPNYIGARLCFGTRTGVNHHDHCFGSSCGFIEQTCIGQFHSGQLTNHRLIIEQRFQTPL